jgi:hypothetical protein
VPDDVLAIDDDLSVAVPNVISQSAIQPGIVAEDAGKIGSSGLYLPRRTGCLALTP